MLQRRERQGTVERELSLEGFCHPCGWEVVYLYKFKTGSKVQAVGLSGGSILCVKHVLHTNDFSQMIESFSHDNL